MEAIGVALGGLNRNIQQFNNASNRIAGGELEAEPIVESKIAQRGIEANVASLKSIFETEETLLDILA